MKNKQPVLFVSHGSPMTAIDAGELGSVWQSLAARLERPAAVLMISAHWTSRQPLVSGNQTPETIHDFGGFPAELYRLHYPALGSPALSQRIKDSLTNAGFEASVDAVRGLDHGAWVPLRTLLPVADVPVVQLSVQPERNAQHHYALGSALQTLSDENVLIIASGHMTHNLGELFRRRTKQPAPETIEFRNWVHERLMSGVEDEALLDWTQRAPAARYAHPSPEHFLPLFVALGAAGKERTSEWLGGGWVEASLAADNYLFSSPAAS